MVDPNKPEKEDNDGPTIGSDEVSSPLEEWGRYLSTLEEGVPNKDDDKEQGLRRSLTWTSNDVEQD